jgi:hypothetical protein
MVLIDSLLKTLWNVLFVLPQGFENLGWAMADYVHVMGKWDRESLAVCIDAIGNRGGRNEGGKVGQEAHEK